MGNFIAGIVAGFVVFSNEGSRLRQNLLKNIKATIKKDGDDNNGNEGLDDRKTVSTDS